MAGKTTSPSSGSSDVPTSTISVPYYVEDFFLILDTVVTRDEHLFRGTEMEVFHALRTLPEAAIRLYVRLFNRRGPYLRLDRLDYAEIDDVRGAATVLEACGLVTWHRGRSPVGGMTRKPPSLDLASALRVYTVPEITPLARRIGVTQGRKAELVERLLASSHEHLRRDLLAIAELLEVPHRPLLERVHRLFFLNRHQDVSTLVTTNLALVQFPRYRVWRTRPVFRDREGLEAFLEAEAERELFRASLASGDLEAAERVGRRALETLLESWPTSEGVLGRYDAFSVRAGTTMAYLKRFEQSLGPIESARIYGEMIQMPLPDRYRGPVWTRCVITLSKAGQYVDAISVCEKALEDRAVRGGDREALCLKRKKLLRLVRRRGGVVYQGGGALASEGTQEDDEAGVVLSRNPPAPSEVIVWSRVVSRGPGQRVQFAGANRGVLTVENVAIEAYRQQGADGIQSENAFFTTLFGVLFWDILFMDMPDVFQTPYQDAPLDLETDHFFSARRAAIQQRLRDIRGGAEEILRDHYGRFQGVSARGVTWEAYSVEELAKGMRKIGGERLAGIMENLARDYASMRRGFPDLLMWPRRGPRDQGETEYREIAWMVRDYQAPADVWFVEVKSARDRLGPYQTAWIRQLTALGFHVEICRVLDAVHQERGARFVSDTGCQRGADPAEPGKR